MKEFGPTAQETQPGAVLTRQLRRQWAVVEVGATVVGVFVVATFLRAFHDVGVSEHSDEAALGLYLAIGLRAMWVWRERQRRAVWRWLREERAPDGREQALALREPLREAATQAAFWGAAAMLFAGLMLSVSVQHAVELALAIVLGGVTTCALSYLLVERLLRPVTARALGSSRPSSR
jgi:adenylate cyclase